MINNNPYHDRLREFAQGHIADENKQGNCKMVHIRLPMYVYKELNQYAQERNIATGRLIIEILRSGADKRIKTKQENEALLDDIVTDWPYAALCF